MWFPTVWGVIASAAITLWLAWLVMTQPSPLADWFFYAAIVSTGATIAMGILPVLRSRIVKVEPIHVIALGLVIAAGGAGWQWHRNHSVPSTAGMRPAFVDAYEHHVDKLGKARGGAVNSPGMSGVGQKFGAYQVAFNKGAAFWIHESQMIFAVLDNGTWFQQHDTTAANEWHNKEQVRKLLKVPNDREPPQGGVAKHSFDEPEKWKPLGDLLWHCNLDGTDIWRQRFEHGTIIGPFRINPNDDGGVLYILFDDQTWQKELGKQPAPKFWPVVWASA